MTHQTAREHQNRKTIGEMLLTTFFLSRLDHGGADELQSSYHVAFGDPGKRLEQHSIGVS